jgi:hypothetical protein
MKKSLLSLLFIVSFFGYAQQYVSVLPTNGSTSGLSRAPQGTQRYIRTCYVISQAEITASGLPNSSVLNAISFEYLTAQNAATTGTLKVYLENTTDATYLKTSTTWTNVITGMTLAHNAATTIPAATGFWDIPFSGGSSFTYTGGGIYVAFEYENVSGSIATSGNVALCNNTNIGSLRNATSTTTMPAALGATASNFRPSTRFAYPATCISPSNVLVNTITSTSANVTFTVPPSAPANGYEYFLATTATAPTASTSATATTTATTISLTSLSPTTTYYVWIRSVCSSTDKSIWVQAPVIITTAVVPYTYGFEDATQPGWRLLNAGTGGSWGIGNGAGLAATGTNYAAYTFNATNPGNAWLFSRDIELTAGTQYLITFKVRARDDAGVTYPESMKATIGNGITVAAQTTTLWDSGANGVNYLTYTQQTSNFTPTTSGVYVLGFNCYSSANQFQLLLDDVSVTAVLSNEDFDSNSISIYPNPTSSVLNISNTNNFEIKNISVTDINGRVVKNQTSSLTRINVSDLNAGVYFVTIEAAEGKTTKKFIKQ